MPSLADFLAGAAVTTVFLTLVLVTELWKRWGNPPAEWTRKLIHIVGGVISLSLPFVLDSHWIVLGMAVGMATLFLLGKIFGQLQSLHDVSRKSSGTEYYPFVVYLLFLCTQHEPWKYIICMLVLSTADGLAALIGSRYGRFIYEVDENHKSLEGSLVFLLVSFTAVSVPLYFWPFEQPYALSTIVLTALLTAILTTMFEAVAQEGRDNLWTPLIALIVLNKVLHLPSGQLLSMLGVLFAMTVLIGVLAWRTKAFNVGGALVLILSAYASWTLLSFVWALPSLLAIGFYFLLEYLSEYPIRIASRPVVKALFIPIILMVSAAVLEALHDVERMRFLFGPFLAACVTVAGQAVWDQILRDRELKGRKKWFSIIKVTVLAGICTTLPPFLVLRDSWLVSLVAVNLAALLASVPCGILSDRDVFQQSDQRWWQLRLLTIALAAGLAAAMQAVGICPPWKV